MGWSPEQIAGRMKLEKGDQAVSAESIYRFVYNPEGRRARLPRQLAQRKAKRGRRRRNGKREPSIPDRTPDPPEVDGKPTCAASSGTGRAI